MSFVLDASALAKLALDEEDADAFRAWFADRIEAGARLMAPGLVLYELMQVFWRRVVPAAQTGEHWGRDLVRDVTIGVDLDHDAWARADRWRGRLTAYDACYLALAETSGSSLVTYDGRLAAAAMDSVPVITPQ